MRVAADLREWPSGEPLWEPITRAAPRQLEPGPEVRQMPPQEPADRVPGLRVMPAEMPRAGEFAKKELATAIADRTCTDPESELCSPWQPRA
ncbi:hypothetical protein [Streptomyces sp. NPDC088746]|uniref:hypothetical protein n=1 Tax=Streptomyces sp. NPDC088746 TaxID=3365885 RepID=UPI00380A573C